MAHYAILDEKYIVTNVFVGKDEDELDNDGNPVNWEDFYSAEVGSLVKRTSYNTSAGVHAENRTPFRKNYAGIGYSYDPIRDAFVPPKNYVSWVFDEETCTYKPPIANPSSPTDGTYQWFEPNQEWILIQGPAE
jgi:hypothetical protein